MNDIEKMFYDALCRHYKTDVLNEDHTGFEEVAVQKAIGMYKVDFYFRTECVGVPIEIVVEIDGHESHKTKEQRYNDYQRERFLQKRGISIIRFMGSEVYVDPDECVKEFRAISDKIAGDYWQAVVNSDFENDRL